MAGGGNLHDRALLDALEAMVPVAFEANVWRVTRAGRDPSQGSSAQGRWSPDHGVGVLYTSLEREGALAEIGFRLSLEPVWPRRIQHEIHEISARTMRSLRFANVASLAGFGIDPARYQGFEYGATQAVAGAAHFLDFDGLIVPSARHAAANLVIFTDRVAATALRPVTTGAVDWTQWRKRQR